jgi:hypothetical protein
MSKFPFSPTYVQISFFPTYVQISFFPHLCPNFVFPHLYPNFPSVICFIFRVLFRLVWDRCHSLSCVLYGRLILHYIIHVIKFPYVHKTQSFSLYNPPNYYFILSWKYVQKFRFQSPCDLVFICPSVKEYVHSQVHVDGL